MGENHYTAIYRISSSNYAYSISGVALEFVFVIFDTNFFSSNAVNISGKILEFFHKRKSSLIHNSLVLVWALKSFYNFGLLISKRNSSDEDPIFDLNLAKENSKNVIIILCKIDI